jgi:hypothetical protein
MARSRWLVLAAGAAVGGVAVVSAMRRPPDADARLWRTVSILASADDVMPEGQPPEPLRRMGDAIEVRLVPAPGGRGVELSARIRDPEPEPVLLERLFGGDARSALRRALRESKQLLEAGELPTVEPQPHGTRKPTPTGALVDAVASRSSEEGVL